MQPASTKHTAVPLLCIQGNDMYLLFLKIASLLVAHFVAAVNLLTMPQQGIKFSL